jgi:hypothetical protein
MPQNNPNAPFVKKSQGKDPQPWNRSRVEVEPSEEPQMPEGRYSDRIKISPMDEQGRAKPRAVRNWPEGLKKA